MSKFELPCERAMNVAFKEKGRTDVVMIDVFPINDGDRLTLTFESVNSAWRHGVWLKTDGFLMVDGQKCSSVDIWQDTAPSEVLIECKTHNGSLHLYNIWDEGSCRESQSWTSGMLIEDLPHGRRYRCNDFGFETDFDKLIFRLERVTRPTA